MGDDPFAAFGEEVDVETREFLARAQPLLDAMPPPETMTVDDLRRQAAERSIIPADKVPQGRDATVPGVDGDVPIRILSPDDPQGVYIYIHGGGWVGGHHDRQDLRLWPIAEAANVALVSVGYRLAPEHPYPAASNDCEAAASWTVENAVSRFGSDRIVIGGESAGAHLAAVTLLRMRDRHGYTGFRGVELRYGLYDLRLTPSARLGRMPVFSATTLAWFVSHFAEEKFREDPDVSPLLADLRGMPPALFTVGTDDPLLDDTLFMYARWRAAGSDAALGIYPGGLHAFDMLPIELGRRAVSEMVTFISERVAS